MAEIGFSGCMERSNVEELMIPRAPWLKAVRCNLFGNPFPKDLFVLGVSLIQEYPEILSHQAASADPIERRLPEDIPHCMI